MARLFCLEIGKKHARLEEMVTVYYKGVKKHGIKNVYCPKCKRLVIKNGKLVNQFPERTMISLTQFGKEMLRHDEGELG